MKKIHFSFPQNDQKKTHIQNFNYNASAVCWLLYLPSDVFSIYIKHFIGNWKE